ncbi:Tetratricopeptide TPR_4 [Catenulispora acidiphila DSM 44928]|uniref:Tetratricopeptide TPR_4 n=1 Tax=Catenulispora acidiphila (strain DSM 44928 / JCM 14897 / NBRC 102108 / NRRL B-24433 / ID139908) TaxID=479433 RepID=C7Q7Z3_CATAD|nr:CHAT domain-containing protein [Catenulispora acidiphila]ACU74160.1 Tetratricopeptide TPR_4 [Catenulispora acidiphila DSM 44928]
MPSSATDRLALALSALDQVLAQPAAGRAEAEAVLAGGDDDEAAAIALRAIGLSWKENGDLARAAKALRRGVAVAEKGGLAYRAAEARMSLVVILADRGNTEGALAEAALADSILTGLDRARLRVNLALVLGRIGRTAEALDALDSSQPVLASYGDARWEAIALNLRGIIQVYRGAGQPAQSDLLRAARLTEDGGYRLLNAIVLGNLGFAAHRAGDLPSALYWFDAAVERFAEHDKPVAPMLVDRAEALLTAGLSTEAHTTLRQAIAEQERSGFGYDRAEYHLIWARAALADGDPTAAEDAARTARGMFGRQRRAAWADLARHVEASARFATGERSPALLKTAVELADRMAAAKWPVTPLEARLLAGRIAFALDRREQALALFEQVARHRNRREAEVRILAWHAHALHALTAGRASAAERALHAGLRVHQENNAVLGATDLRAHAAARGEELAKLGLQLALKRGDARAVLRWAETWRAASLRRRPVRPPDDEQLAADLAELRRVVAELAAVEAPTARGSARTEVSRLNGERLRLEAAIRDRSRYARGTYAPEPPFSPATLAGALGTRVLVEFMRLDDDLHAVTVRDGVVRRHRLGSYAAVLRQLDVVRFAMNRMSRRFGSAAMQDAAVEAYDHSRRELDALLFGPVRGSLDGVGGVADRPLIVVPTGSLHALPWTALPTCAGRAVSVTPSARLWLAAANAAGAAESAASAAGSEALATSSTGVGTVLMAGPGLAHAEPEIAALAARYPDAVVLSGAEATAANTAHALDGAALAHVATHGRFRADHPLFSSLDAFDGPLYVYDLERLGATPQTLVLSACESALSGVRPGDELMGLASAVFALGTRTLIASVTPVDDRDTRTLMLALHAELASGHPAAAALAEASEATGIGGFVCFGFGG